MRRSTILFVLLLLSQLSPHSFGQDFKLLAPLQRRKTHHHGSHEVVRLAKEIDWLESVIDNYGTIVPKQPDVWGEARLTKHRRETDAELSKELESFSDTLNGSLRRSDQSFLGFAMSLTGAVNGATESPEITQIVGLAEPAADAIARTAPGKLEKANTKVDKISIEPTVFIQQKYRYLQLLNELRRLNEGDDIADGPGYALNLVRIPVSILPGKMTRTGFGAEVTMTVESHLTPELLPNTFRNLVVNDVVSLLSLPLAKVFSSDELSASVKKVRDYYALRQRFEQILDDNDYFAKSTKNNVNSVEFKAILDAAIEDTGLSPQLSMTMDSKIATNYASREEAIEPLTIGYRAWIDELEDEIKKSSLAATSRFSRRSRSAIPPAQLFDIFDASIFAAPLEDAERLISENRGHELVAHVETYLTSELHSAYEFLNQENARCLWSHCSKELVSAIRGRKRVAKRRQAATDTSISELRENFFRDLRTLFPRANFSATAALAWAVIVDSALLNQRLVEDMEKVGLEQEDFDLTCLPIWPDFYATDPHADARELFNTYVKRRWPIKVFALDPANDEQNIQDSFSARREMQVAVAAALATGNITPAAASNFIRRMEVDMETVALNAKTIGFVHGENTFGWRFAPRFQTPRDIGSARALWQTVAGTPSRDRLLDQRQLEPGMRELTAVILTPSFVPQLEFESRANWFRLSNPKHKEFSFRDAVKVSSAWSSVSNRYSTLCNTCGYRADDIKLLGRAVEQLESDLPLQSMRVPIPYDNTLGGFEMFDSGITDLAPSLSGYYGAPGVSVGEKDASTTLFLVGKNFSVHDTVVVVGGAYDKDSALISREVIRVKVPNTAIHHDGKIDVHVATPYGVSNHLDITAVLQEKKKEAPKTGFQWDKKEFCGTVDCPKGEIEVADGIDELKIENLGGNPTPGPVSKPSKVGAAPCVEKATGEMYLVGLVYANTQESAIGQTDPITLGFEESKEAGLGSLVVSEDQGALCDGGPPVGKLKEQIEAIVKKAFTNGGIEKLETLKVEGYVQLGNWPPVKLVNSIEIKFKKCK